MDIEIDKLLIKLAVAQQNNPMALNLPLTGDQDVDLEYLVAQCVEQVLRQRQRRADH